MLDIQRVKAVCKWLIYKDYADNDKELADLIGYTKSSFSQIMNGKVPLSSKFIDKLCSLDDNINKVWVLRNEGDMLKNIEHKFNASNENIKILERENKMLSNMIKDKDKLIDALEYKISILSKNEVSQDKSKSSNPVADVIRK